MSLNYKKPTFLFDLIFIVSMSVFTGLIADFLLYSFAGLERRFSTLEMIGVASIFTTFFTISFRVLTLILNRLIPLDRFSNLVITIIINILLMTMIFLLVIKLISVVFATVTINIYSIRFQLLFGVSTVAYTFGIMFYYAYQFYQQYTLTQERLIRSLKSALDAQIRPHFLFNTLNNIGILISRHPQEAERATEYLADLYRYILKSSKQNLIYLDQEIDFINKYIELEMIRFGEDLIFRSDILVKTDQIQIPGLLIQPIIENSIKHGFNYSAQPLEISLEIKVDVDVLSILVKDNGPGFGQSRKVSDLKSRGTGLENIQNKLKLHYGQESNISLNHNLVTINIPYEKL